MNYEDFSPKIEQIIKAELVSVFKNMLKNEFPLWSQEYIDLKAISFVDIHP